MKLFDTKVDCWTFEGSATFTGDFDLKIESENVKTFYFESEGVFTITIKGQTEHYYVQTSCPDDDCWDFDSYDIYKLETDLEVLKYRTRKQNWIN